MKKIKAKTMKGSGTWTASKQMRYTISSMFWGDCPHCKKPIVMTDLPAVKHLGLWRKAVNKLKGIKSNN